MGLSLEERKVKKAEYAAAGISVIVSVFGSSDTPTTSGVDPVHIATTMAQFVISNDLDGIDVSYGDGNAFMKGTAEAWLSNFTQTLRLHLPQGEYILAHSCGARWMAPSTSWPAGGYAKVNQNVGSMIDFVSRCAVLRVFLAGGPCMY